MRNKILKVENNNNSIREKPLKSTSISEKSTKSLKQIQILANKQDIDNEGNST